MSKPEWNEDTPKWANWLAQDQNGIWFWWKDRPIPSYGLWGLGGKFLRASHDDFNENWRDTLEPRP